MLLQLCIRLHNNADWRVYRNYAEHGCDLVLVGRGRQIRIEVKTRQNVIRKREKRSSLHFILSDSERTSSHFVVAYWFDKSAYFVMPTSELRPYRSGNKMMHRFIAYYSTIQNDYTEQSKNYFEAWHYILDALNP